MKNSYKAIDRTATLAVGRLDPHAESAKRLIDFPLAKAFGWGYARGLPTDDQLRVYRQRNELRPPKR